MNDTAVSIRDMQFRWQPHAPMTLSIDAMDIRRGERVFVSGQSGVGKSTLLNLLCGIHTPQQGEIHVLGTPLHHLGQRARDHFRRDSIGVIFQQFNLLPYLDVIENVHLPCRLSATRRHNVHSQGRDSRAEAARLLSALHIDNHLHDRPVQALSVGQQQRVAAARALIGGPALIIADEPTSALDENSEQAFIHLLLEQCAATQATLVFVSHQTRLQAHFDRVVSLQPPHDNLHRDGGF